MKTLTKTGTIWSAQSIKSMDLSIGTDFAGGEHFCRYETRAARGTFSHRFGRLSTAIWEIREQRRSTKTSPHFSSPSVMIIRIECVLLAKATPSLRPQCCRYSTSSKRWVARQRGDAFTREAKVQQYKSRAAFKLLEVPLPPPPTSPYPPPKLNRIVEREIPHLQPRTNCH